MWGIKTKSVNLNRTGMNNSFMVVGDKDKISEPEQDWNEQQLHGYVGDKDKISEPEQRLE